MKVMKFTPVLLVVFFILITFTIPVAALSADCPCFTAKDVIRYASHPSKFTCVWDYGQGWVRLLERGKYNAGFGVSYDNDGEGDKYGCSAYVYVGDDSDPDVVLFEAFKKDGDITDEQYDVCEELLLLGNPQDCTCELLGEEEPCGL